MNVSSVLFDILVVLVAAKLAAEVAERVGVPAVVGEILAGIVIGPSVIGLVGTHDETLRTLGEIGVILLLLEVGLEMDLEELGAVGRTSFLVATVGVVTPLALGMGAMAAIGSDFNTALFVGAALTATSVGITARVFGDLRALATTEARIVLGAAVADDVMGLVVLTVVVRLVTEGSVSVLSVLGIVLVAVAFLVVGTVAGLRLAPVMFGVVDRFSRSTGTLVALGLAFTLAFAQLADAAKLAPIVGAFVAGLALTRSAQADRIHRELAPVGHLFIPVFFLQIGIDADVGAFAQPAVLRDAAILLVVAIVGKLVSPIGAIGAPGDKLLIGLGMLPRGEVGLIFATIGLQQGVLGDDLYASLLVVVLVTTLVTPQLLKSRYTRLRARPQEATAFPNAPAPSGEWLRVALDAAVDVARTAPSPALLDWLSAVANTPVQWDRRTTDAFMRVLREGNSRSWRFLEIVGALDRALPELAEALRSRQQDALLLDPMSTHRWAAVERLGALSLADPLYAEFSALAHPEWLLLGALLSEALQDHESPVAEARQIVRRLDLGAAAEQEIALLVADRDLLWSSSHRPDGLGQQSVLQVATHLDKPEHARALYVLSAVRADDREPWEAGRLRELYELVQAALSHPELTGLEARNIVGQRRAEATRLVDGVARVVRRIEDAPRAYVLRVDSSVIARHAQLLEPTPSPDEARVIVTPSADGWWIDVGARDRPALLATVAGVLVEEDVDVSDAVVATWDDGAALESFHVRAEVAPQALRLRERIESSFGGVLTSTPLPEAIVAFDDGASPWHTVCEVRAPDKPGVLHALASAFAAAEVEVHAAAIAGDGGEVVDRFEVTDRNGRKIDDDAKRRIVTFVENGVSTRRRRFRRSVLFV
jgi:Kef-type K+ transport system membrane component KefB